LKKCGPPERHMKVLPCRTCVD